MVGPPDFARKANGLLRYSPSNPALRARGHDDTQAYIFGVVLEDHDILSPEVVTDSGERDP